MVRPTVDNGIIHGVNSKVPDTPTLAYKIVGESFEKFGETPPIPEDYEFGKMFWELSSGLLASWKVKTVKAEVNRGGKVLEGVIVGLKEMKEGKVGWEVGVFPLEALKIVFRKAGASDPAMFITKAVCRHDKSGQD
jgi:hypothetical protein